MTAKTATNDRKTFHSIQIWRGLGALLITLGHSHIALKYLSPHVWTYADPDRPLGLFSSLYAQLYLGVDLFFCASGLIMAMLVAEGGEDRPGLFTWRRLTRIYPAYWLFSLPVLIAFLLNPAFNLGQFSGVWGADIERFLLSLALIPQDKPPVLGVGWTLIHEMQFYIAIVILLALGLARRLFEGVLVIAMVAVGLDLAGISIMGGQVFSLYWVEFLFGIVVYRLYPVFSRYAPALQIAGAVALYCVLAVILDSTGTHATVADMSLTRAFGAGLMSLLLGCGGLGMEARWNLSGTFVRLLVLLGNASYVLYLSHWLLLSVIGKLAGVLLPQGLGAWTLTALQALAVTLCALFAVSLHLVVEKPFNRWVRRIEKSWRARHEAVAKTVTG